MTDKEIVQLITDAVESELRAHGAHTITKNAYDAYKVADIHVGKRLTAGAFFASLDGSMVYVGPLLEEVYNKLKRLHEENKIKEQENNKKMLIEKLKQIAGWKDIPKPKDGDLIYALYNNRWEMKFFSHYDDEGIPHAYTGQNKKGDTMTLSVFTTNNPFEND